MMRRLVWCIIVAGWSGLGCLSPLPLAGSDTASPAETRRQIFERQLEILQTLERQLTDLRAQSEGLAQRLTASRQELAISAQELETLRGRLAGLNGTLTKLQESSGELKRSYGESQMALRALRLDLQRSAHSLRQAQRSTEGLVLERWIFAAGGLGVGLLLGWVLGGR